MYNHAFLMPKPPLITYKFVYYRFRVNQDFAKKSYKGIYMLYSLSNRNNQDYHHHFHARTLRIWRTKSD